jgi:hypothetical protein
MPSTSETILSNQTHPGDSTTETVTGDKFKGDGYYGRSDGLHSIQYNVSGFIGTVVMQATLATNPTSDDWFTISNTEHTSTNDSAANGDGSYIYNFTGNYVWVRSYVSNWTDGIVQSVVLNH